MPKKISDVVPPNKRTIRHIPLPRERKKKGRAEVVEYPEEVVEDQAPIIYEPENVDRPPRSNKLLFLAVTGVLILSFFLVSWMVSGATVTITPRTESRQINAIITAATDKSMAKELVFEKIELQKSANIELAPDGEQNVNRKATGTIVVYNNYSSEPQRLIKHTRFETPQGLIYRINEAVNVPGKKTVDGKAVPGGIEVTVYADQSGESHNIGMSDFTIPGFKGDAERYKNFYARSKTPIEGGFSGTEKYVTEEKIKVATEALQERLKNDLQGEARTATPESFILYDNAHLTTFEPLRKESKATTVSVTLSARLTGFLLKKEDLGVVVSKKTGLDSADAEHRIRVGNLDDLAFSFQGIPDGTTESISFRLEGSPFIIWKFDEEGVRQALRGKEESEADSILKGFIGIEKAEIVTRPFWTSSFPEDGRDIQIRTTLPNE